jgi:predicted dehydrogenase
MVRIGVVGLGYWGPKLVRVFEALPSATVVAVCDLNPVSLAEFAATNRSVQTVSTPEALLRTPGLDAVVIATPTSSHFQLAQQALERGLHVFVEKPLAMSSEECHVLTRLAKRQRRVLFVGHVYLYTPAVGMLKALLDAGDLGDPSCISSVRRNLGPVRSDVNSLWDLAPHDISIIVHLLGGLPVSVNCQGLALLRPGVEDVCNLTMHFSGNRMATVHTSWIDPVKIRQMTVIGSRCMAIFDDMEPTEKVRLYDSAVERPAGDRDFVCRNGSVSAPPLAPAEPLLAECQHFMECVRSGAQPRTGGAEGEAVVRVLEAADRSLRAGGSRVLVEPTHAELLIPAVA